MTSKQAATDSPPPLRARVREGGIAAPLLRDDGNPLPIITSKPVMIDLPLKGGGEEAAILFQTILK
jgi:hypothetical protein